MVVWEHCRLPYRRVPWLPVGLTRVHQVIALCPCTHRWHPRVLLVVAKRALACRGSVSFSLEGRNLGRAFSITVADCQVGGDIRSQPEPTPTPHRSPRTPLQTLTFDLHPLIILQIAWLCPAISANSPAQWNFAFRPAHMRFLPRGYQAWGEVMQRLHNLEEVRRTPQLTLGWVAGSNGAELHYGDSHVPRRKFTLAFLCSHCY